MAEISPICSIMDAMAIGAMARIAVKSNLQNSNGGTLTQEALATSAKLKMAEPSGFVMPQKCRIKATA